MWKSGGISRTSTAAHKRWAAAVKKRDQHQCQARYPGCLGAGTQADHIIPVAEHGAEFDPANGQAICASCHKTKTNLEAQRGKARRQRARPPRPHPGG